MSPFVKPEEEGGRRLLIRLGSEEEGSGFFLRRRGEGRGKVGEGEINTKKGVLLKE